MLVAPEPSQWDLLLSGGVPSPGSWEGQTNFPAGWEALGQLMDSRDVAADGCDVVAIHAYGCVFLETQEGSALAVGCVQDLTFLREEGAYAAFA